MCGSRDVRTNGFSGVHKSDRLGGFENKPAVVERLVTVIGNRLL